MPSELLQTDATFASRSCNMILFTASMSNGNTRGPGLHIGFHDMKSVIAPKVSKTCELPDLSHPWTEVIKKSFAVFDDQDEKREQTEGVFE